MLEIQKNKSQILVFIATNYEEGAFAAISKHLIAHHLSIITGGLATGAVHGCDGSATIPQYTLSSLLKMIPFQNVPILDGILLTGGVQSINHLFADPRLHEFLEWFVSLGKMVGICQPLPYELVVSSKVAQSDTVLLQNGESYAQFIDQFVERVS